MDYAKLEDYPDYRIYKIIYFSFINFYDLAIDLNLLSLIHGIDFDFFNGVLDLFVSNLEYSGLARFTLTQAMRGLSTKGVPNDRVSANARKIGLANIRVKSSGGDSAWTVEVTDSLAYAAKAFKRADAVEYAMAKAANSIAGMLRKRAKDLLDPSLATPFPEIAQHRRGA